MKRWLVCGLVAVAVGAGTVSMSATEAPPPADLSTVQGVVEALYRGASFEPGGEPNWALLRSLMLPGAVVAQPVRGSDEVEPLTVDQLIGRFEHALDGSTLRETGFHEAIVRLETAVFGRIAHCHVVYEPRTGDSSAAPLGRGVDSITLVRTGGRWWIASIATELEQPGRPIPESFVAAVSSGPVQAGAAAGSCSGKLDFDLAELDENGLIGPPDGKVAVSYELCVPKDQKLVDEVRSIDPSIAIHADSRGRIGCSPMEVLCLGSTHQRSFREILERLCALPYVRRIERTWFE
jgi:hypothetical protein